MAPNRACVEWRRIHHIKLTKEDGGFHAFTCETNAKTCTYSENTLNYGNSSLGAWCASALESAISEHDFLHAVTWAQMGSTWDQMLPNISSNSKQYSFEAVEIERTARETFLSERLMKQHQSFYEENSESISHMEEKRREEEERRGRPAFGRPAVEKWLLQETKTGTEVRKLDVLEGESGISKKDLAAVQAAGFGTVQSLAWAPRTELLAIEGISERKADKLLDAAGAEAADLPGSMVQYMHLVDPFMAFVDAGVYLFSSQGCHSLHASRQVPEHSPRIPRVDRPALPRCGV